MAYNAGEYRVFGALKRHGQRAMDARPDALTSLPGITRAYVRKLHALSCVLAEAEDRDLWIESLDRKVPRLVAIDLPPSVDSLKDWSDRQGLDAAVVKRLNPAFRKDHIGRVAAGSRVLVPATRGTLDRATEVTASGPDDLPGQPRPTSGPPQSGDATVAPAHRTPRTHTVARGESAWIIARRYDVDVSQLLARNGLDRSSMLQPGMVLAIDARTTEPGAAPPSVAN
jgi:membrane-bound lytic murein transglycosylase D